MIDPKSDYWRKNIGDVVFQMMRAPIDVAIERLRNQFNIIEAAHIMDDPEMTPDKAASIFNNLTADEGALIMDNANLTAAKAASIADNANLPETKLQSILDNKKLSIRKGQDIVNNMLQKGKIATSDRITLLKDDFDDDKVTDRDRAGIYADYIYIFMRPEWKGDLTDASVSDGRLTITTAGSEIYVDYMRERGTKLHAISYCYDPGSGFGDHTAEFRFIRVDENNYYFVGPGGEGGYYRRRFGKVVNGTYTLLWNPNYSSNQSGTYEVKADGGGNYEVLKDGVSCTTITDTDITENYGVGLAAYGVNNVRFDNLDIKHKW